MVSRPSAWQITYAVDSASSSASARLSHCSWSTAWPILYASVFTRCAGELEISTRMRCSSSVQSPLTTTLREVLTDPLGPTCTHVPEVPERVGIMSPSGHDRGH